MKLKTIALAAFAIVAASSAEAGITTFSGQDDGAPIGGPFPNSDTAASSLLTAAAVFGPVYTETFDTIPVGTGANGGSFNIPGASVSSNYALRQSLRRRIKSSEQQCLWFPNFRRKLPGV